MGHRRLALGRIVPFPAGGGAAKGRAQTRKERQMASRKIADETTVETPGQVWALIREVFPEARFKAWEVRYRLSEWREEAERWS